MILGELTTIKFKSGVIWKGTILEDGVRHGYNTESGGWSLYPIGNDPKPAIHIVFRKYRKKRAVMIDKEKLCLS